MKIAEIDYQIIIKTLENFKVFINCLEDILKNVESAGIIERKEGSNKRKNHENN